MAGPVSLSPCDGALCGLPAASTLSPDALRRRGDALDAGVAVACALTAAFPACAVARRSALAISVAVVRPCWQLGDHYRQ
jgi:hypothetical protein